MEKRYKIHEVADILGIAPSAIRFYEKKGFFQARKDAHNGYRYYEQDDINKIWSIIYHRTIDMSLDAIASFKHLDSLDKKQEMVRQQIAMKEHRIAEEMRALKIWGFYEKLIDEIMAYKDVLIEKKSAPMHLFGRSFLNSPHSSIYRFCLPVTVFPDEKGELSEASIYTLVRDDYLEMLSGEDRSQEIEQLLPFPCVYTIIQDSSKYDDSHVLSRGLNLAAEQGYAVKPPYYVTYLLSSGGWDNNQRYYEVFMGRT